MGTVHIGGQLNFMVNFGFGSRTVLLGCTMNLIPSPTGIGVGTVGGEGTSASSVHYRGNQQNSHKMFRRPQKHSYKPFFGQKQEQTLFKDLRLQQHS